MRFYDWIGTSIFLVLFSFYIPKCKSKKKDELLRHIFSFTLIIRRICDISRSTASKGAKSDHVVYGQSELESHDETIVLDQNSIIMGYTGHECDVLPYTDTYESIKKIPIVTGETGYTSPIIDQQSILIFNDVLLLGDKMQHTLINPNQLRHFGLILKDYNYAKDEIMRIEVEDGELVIPLQSNGTVIYFDT